MMKTNDRCCHWADYIQSTAQGDHTAFAAFYAETSPIAYKIALRALGNQADAEDAVVDAYVQMWQGASRFESMRGSAQSWLAAIARTRALDRLRSRARLRGEDDTVLVNMAAPQAGPAQVFATRERTQVLKTALKQLPPANRTVLEMAYFEGLSLSQIAAMRQEPVSTVKSRVRRGLELMRRALESRFTENHTLLC